LACAVNVAFVHVWGNSAARLLVSYVLNHCLIEKRPTQHTPIKQNHDPTQDRTGKGLSDSAAGHQLGPPPYTWTTTKKNKGGAKLHSLHRYVY